MKKINILLISFFSILLMSCGETSEKVATIPVDSLAEKMKNEKDFTILLSDMDYRGFDNQYVHKYKIIKKVETPVANESDSVTIDSLVLEETKWIPVSEEYFNKHEPNLGMEILSKNDGKLSTEVAPPGYSHYVGNEKYGEWKQTENNSHSTWHYFGQYMFMRSMFGMAMYPARRSYYNNYMGNRGSGNGFYGAAGDGRAYGTNSAGNNSGGRSSAWSQRSPSYRSQAKANTQTLRNSSRYNNSSSRSRSGSYGK